MAPLAVEVRCAGCGETLEVDHGTTEFACPGCATAQHLPPELMPPPPRPRRAIPLSPADAAEDRVPCGGCGAVLSVPPGFKSFGCPVCAAAARRPQASSSPDRLPAAHPVPPGQEVLEDPLSQATHSGLVHVERYKMPIRSEQSQGWRPNHLVYRDESLSSFRADKRVPIHGGRAHEKSYNPLVHAEDSHIEPLDEITTRLSKNKSRIRSSRVDKVHVDCPSQAIPVDNANQSQGRSPSDTIGRHGKQKTTVAPRIIGKELIEPPNQAAHEQQAYGTSSDRVVHADQVQVEPGSKTVAWNQKRKRSGQSAAGNATMTRPPKTKNASRKSATPGGDPGEGYDPPSQPRMVTRKTASHASQREVSDPEIIALVRAMKAKDQGQSSKQPQVAEDEEGESIENNEENKESTDEEGSDEDMAEAEESEVDLTQISSDDYAILRHANQFNNPANSSDSRFHTRFQQQIYEQLYSHHRKFADHKYIDWAHLEKIDRFAGAFRLFQRAGLEEIVGLRCDYNKEVIRQFYATVYVSSDFDILIWMTGTQRLQATKVEFEQALRTYSGSQENIYDRVALKIQAWRQFYDETVNFVPGKIGGLKPLPSLINRIINHTFFPKSGNFDAIRGHAWNIIEHIMNGRKFDVVDLIIREIGASKNDRIKRVYFAPYIMALIMRKIQFRGGRPGVHKPYKPRDGGSIPPTILPQVQENTPAEDSVTLSQIYSAILEIQSSQQEFQSETNNRFAALSAHVRALQQALSAPQRFGRRRLHSPPKASSSQDPPPQDPAE